MFMDVFFTADPHFYHQRIIDFCRKNFKDLNDMHETLINNWNSKVPTNGLTYILGDFAFLTRKSKIRGILNALNGNKILIRGNHDRASNVKYISCGFDDVSDYRSLIINNQRVILSHYSFLNWDDSHLNAWMLFGHNHGRLNINRRQFVIPKEFPQVGVKTMDVGVDTNNFYPYSFGEIEKIMETL